MRYQRFVSTALVLFIFSTLCYSQSSNLSLTQQCGVYYGSCLSSYPPIESDMSWDMVLSFVILDSACRGGTAQQLADSMKTLSEGSLLIALRAMMKIKRNDPLSCAHMLNIKAACYPEGYLMTYADVYNVILSEYLLRDSVLSNVEKHLLNVDAVFSGDIVSVETRPDSISLPYTVNYTCYRVRVVDFIIGEKIFPTGSDGDDEVVLTVLDIGGRHFPSSTAGAAYDGAEYSKLSVNSRFVFYIDVLPNSRDGLNDYYQISSFPGLFFKVENDYVLDPNHFFDSNESTTAYSEVVALIKIMYNHALGY